MEKRLGGATAREWSVRPGSPPLVHQPPALWEWVDTYHERDLHELARSITRQPMREHKDEYRRMLRYGLKYANDHSATAHSKRGFKFCMLAKAVTTGHLRAEQRRDRKDVLGRIRLVSAGHLQHAARGQ